MVNANELRIGNWVHEAVLGNRQVHAIADIVIDLQADGLYSIDPENIDPIPLTPDVLVACGFHKFNNAWVEEDFDEMNYNKDYFTIWNMHDGEFNLNTTQFPVEITSLHQLQNIYLCLTKKELEYSPKQSH